MENNKNVLENWVETQNKAVNNLVETGRKLSESVLKGEVLQKGTDIYRDWFNNQKSIIESTISGGIPHTPKPTAPAASAAQVTDAYSEILQLQTQLAKTWSEAFQQIGTKGFQAFTPEDLLRDTARLYEKWTGLYNQLIQTATSRIGDLRNFNTQGFNSANNFEQLIASTKTYLKLYDLYQPLFQSWQAASKPGEQGTFDWAAFTKAYHPTQYKEILDQIFQFSSPAKFKEFYEEASKINKSWQESAKKWQETGLEQIKNLNSSLLSTDASQFGAFGTQFVQQLEKAFAPLTRLLPAGKEKENAEAALHLQEKFVQYWNKYTELQYIVYGSGQKALEKLAAETVEKAKAANEFPKYKEFFDQWVNTTESVLVETFGGEDFGKVQGELLKLGLEIKKVLEKQVESYLAPYPVVPRSEADELAQQVHDLRSRVRKLEKELSAEEGDEKSAEEKAAKKAAKKPTVA